MYLCIFYGNADINLQPTEPEPWGIDTNASFGEARDERRVLVDLLKKYIFLRVANSMKQFGFYTSLNSKYEVFFSFFFFFWCEMACSPCRLHLFITTEFSYCWWVPNSCSPFKPGVKQGSLHRGMKSIGAWFSVGSTTNLYLDSTVFSLYYK